MTIQADLFASLRAGDLAQVTAIIERSPNLVNAPLYCYEGHDVLSNSNRTRDGRCYCYSGQKRDGFTFPIHVAAEAGSKALVEFLVARGANPQQLDFWQYTPEEKAHSEAVYAFYEIAGLRRESTERYEGPVNAQGLPEGRGTLLRKKEGYHEKEYVAYEGEFLGGKKHGSGTLFHAATKIPEYVGSFRFDLHHGHGELYNFEGRKMYRGTFVRGKRSGHGVEFDAHGDKIYDGEYRLGHRHGRGIAHIPGGHVYEGEYFAGRMHGYGVYRQPGGKRYEGMFKANKYHGPGVLRNGDGTLEAGTWSEGQLLHPVDAATFTHPTRPELTWLDRLEAVVSRVHSGECYYSEEPALLVAVSFVSGAADMFDELKRQKEVSQPPIEFLEVEELVFDAVQRYDLLRYQGVAPNAASTSPTMFGFVGGPTEAREVVDWLLQNLTTIVDLDAHDSSSSSNNNNDGRATDSDAHDGNFAAQLLELVSDAASKPALTMSSL